MKKASIFLTSMAAIALLFSCGSESSSDDMDTPDPITSLSGSKTTLNFPDTEILTTSELKVTIENDGNQDVKDITLSTTKFQFETSSLSFDITAGNSKEITVTFKPTEAINYTDNLLVKANNETLVEITLSGKGTAPATPGKVTFTKDIKPLIENKCGSCHTSGPNRLYNVYTTASNRIDNIINRINRNATGDNELMPQGGPKLSPTELALFQQWVTDGKLEN
ncbi:Ig-like domain-containing protein [Wenyingzhuangia sp. IMCC45574]